MNNTTHQHLKRSLHNQCITMDPKKMIAPVYGMPNITSLPTIYMNAPVNCPVKKAEVSAFRRFIGNYLPFLAGLTTFAVVLCLLTFFMDESHIRLQRFRLNMTRDEEMNIPNNDPQLIEFIRWQLSTRNVVPTPFPQVREHNGMVPFLAREIIGLSTVKRNGYFVQSVTNHSGFALTAPYLAEHFNWTGLIVEPDARKYFSICDETTHAQNVKVFQACVSPKNHPKEIMLPEEVEEANNNGVHINRLNDDNQIWFNPRAKCYPMYSLILAVNRTDIDLLSLGGQGHELEILRTIPFDRVKIKLITIHLEPEHYNPMAEPKHRNFHLHTMGEYPQAISKFLRKKGYRLINKFSGHFFYRSVDSNTNDSEIKSPSNLQ